MTNSTLGEHASVHGTGVAAAAAGAWGQPMQRPCSLQPNHPLHPEPQPARHTQAPTTCITQQMPATALAASSQRLHCPSFSMPCKQTRWIASSSTPTTPQHNPACRRLAQHWVNNVWAKVSTSLFYPVEVVGRENLPPSDRAVVYVANHQSFLVSVHIV